METGIGIGVEAGLGTSVEARVGAGVEPGVESLKIEKIIIDDTYDRLEFYFKLTNTGSESVFIEKYDLYEQNDLSQLGIEDSNCVVFRTGRHKNDMPSVFRLGSRNEAMADAMGGMTETGDKSDANTLESCILSDHFTALGDKGSYTCIYFPEGHKQMVQTAIFVDEKGVFNRLVSSVILGVNLQPGKCIETERIVIEHTDSVERCLKGFVERKVNKYGARNQANPSVFCTWYYYGLTVTYEDVRVNLEKMQQRKLPFDVFQIDEGWEITLGEWEPNKKFPKPMKEICDEIKAAGYRPGIWTSPFVAHETATVWKNHPEWALKDKEGRECLFPMNDTVYWVFDITNPETWDYFYELYRKLTFDWGYTYHKLDFTRAAVIMENAVYYDDSITLTEAYVNAVKAIRRGMGEDSYFLMCGGLYDPIIGLVDAQRTGSDVLSMWASNINKGGKTAPYTVKQSILRYYMNGWWNNNPDALMIRKNAEMERNLRLTYGLLNDEEVKTSTINQYMGGGLVCSTEPLDKIDDERLGNLKRIMPVIKTEISPLDLMNDTCRYPENVLVRCKDKPISSIVRVNWSDNEDLDISFVLKDIMLPESCDSTDRFVICDYYSGQYLTDVAVDDYIKLSSLKPHSATVIKVEQYSESPVIVRSTGHYSMGGEPIIMKFTEDKHRLSIQYENVFDWDIHYEVLLPKGITTLDNKQIIEFDIKPLESFKGAWDCEYAE